MKKSDKRRPKDFDRQFDEGRETIDFSAGVITTGLSQVVKLPPLNIPSWLALEIARLAKIQANSKASVVRQLLVEAIEARHHRASGV